MAEIRQKTFLPFFCRALVQLMIHNVAYVAKIKWLYSVQKYVEWHKNIVSIFCMWTEDPLYFIVSKLCPPLSQFSRIFLYFLYFSRRASIIILEVKFSGILRVLVRCGQQTGIVLVFSTRIQIFWCPNSVLAYYSLLLFLLLMLLKKSRRGSIKKGPLSSENGLLKFYAPNSRGGTSGKPVYRLLFLRWNVLKMLKF